MSEWPLHIRGLPINESFYHIRVTPIHQRPPIHEFPYHIRVPHWIRATPSTQSPPSQQRPPLHQRLTSTEPPPSHSPPSQRPPHHTVSPSQSSPIPQSSLHIRAQPFGSSGMAEDRRRRRYGGCGLLSSPKCWGWLCMPPTLDQSFVLPWCGWASHYHLSSKWHLECHWLLWCWWLACSHHGNSWRWSRANWVPRRAPWGPRLHPRLRNTDVDSKRWLVLQAHWIISVFFSYIS